MRLRFGVLAAALFTASVSVAQVPCQPTPAYEACELILELNEEEAAAHPNPYLSVEINGEFRSPRHRTVRLAAFWDGGRRMVIRFAPTEPGEWEYRLSGNIARFDNKVDRLTAAPSENPGFVRTANVHHWAYTEGNRPHLWMGDTSYGIASLDKELFRKVVDARAEQKFTHIRGLALGKESDTARIFANPDQPDLAFFRDLDERVRYMNSKGIVFDMILGHDGDQLAKLFPKPEQRERYIRYMAARYGAFNVTWQLVQEFEEYERGRELMRELGLLLKKLDPYQHPRSTHTLATSSPLLADGWMDYVLYQSSDIQLGSIEHQLYPVPFVNSEFGYEDSGAGKSHPHHVDANTFRRRLWHATMNGQYPTYGNTGTYGGRKVPPDFKHLQSPGAKLMTLWFDFFSKTRHWELEPYFDLDGGRAIALPGVEYIAYIDQPGPVEVRVEKHGYDVAWFDPASGESIPVKNFKGDKFASETPDKTRDWVLHISREGRKESMLRSYKFESRPVLMQEPETSPKKVPFDIVRPEDGKISAANPPEYQAKLARETRGTRSMMYLWTGEAAADGQGFRVLGTGEEGKLNIPEDLALRFPAVLNVRVYGMNANGKIYIADRVYKLTQ